MNNETFQEQYNAVIDKFLNLPFAKKNIFSLEKIAADDFKIIDPKLFISKFIFGKDDQNCNLFYYIYLDNNKTLLTNLFTKYKKEIGLLDVEKLHGIFFENNESTQIVHAFFADKKEEILKNLKQKDILFMPSEYLPELKKYNLDTFISYFQNTKNIEELNSSHYSTIVKTLCFINYNPTKSLNVDKWLVSTNKAEYKDMFLLMPNENDINILIELIGEENTNSSINKFLNLAFKKNIHLKLYTKDFTSIKTIDFNETIKTNRAFKQSLLKNLELLSYLTLTKKINPNILLEFISDPELKKESQFYLLKDDINPSSNQSKFIKKI